MHAQWPYKDCKHAYSDLYTLYTANPYVCVCVCVFFLNLWHSLHSESVTAKGILHRRVRQHHVRITEHAQTIQAEGLDAQLILQREASLWVKTFRHCGECTAYILWQTGVGVIWEREKQMNVSSSLEHTSSCCSQHSHCPHHLALSSLYDGGVQTLALIRPEYQHL